MPLDNQEIQTEVTALEAIIVTYNSVRDVLAVKQKIKNKLETITKLSDRVVILQRLLTQSDGFQEFLAEKLATSTDIRETGLLDFCAWLIAFYKQNRVALDTNILQTNNLQKTLEVSITKKLRDGWLSAPGDTPYEALIDLYELAPLFFIPPGTIIATAQLIPIIPRLILSPGVQAVKRTWDSYETQCKIVAKILTDQILDHAIIKDSIQFTRYNMHDYVFFSIQNIPNNFDGNEETKGNHKIFVGKDPDNENRLCYETHYSTGIKCIDRTEAIDFLGEKRTNVLFSALNAVNFPDSVIDDTNIKADILAAIVLKGHAYYPDYFRDGDIKLLKEIVWDNITKLKDPARRLTGLQNLLNWWHPLCRLMDIHRFASSSPSHFTRVFRYPLENRTRHQGTRKGILDYIQDAEAGCVAEFLSEEDFSTLKSLEKILHLYELNQYIVKLEKMLIKYETAKKIDTQRNNQIIYIRSNIKEASQVFTDASLGLNPKGVLTSLILLVNQEMKRAQADHCAKHDVLSIHFKPNSQFSQYIFNLNKRDFKSRVSREWTVEIAYLFLQLANSLIKNSKKNSTKVGPLPFVLIMEISRFLTGFDESQTKILWKQYCEFNSQSPAVQQLNGEGRWKSGLFSNTSVSCPKELLNDKKTDFDENEQNKGSELK